MKYSNLAGQTIIIMQSKGVSRINNRQKSTLIGLGLRGINSSIEHIGSKEILGMVKKVEHLIKVRVK